MKYFLGLLLFFHSAMAVADMDFKFIQPITLDGNGSSLTAEPNDSTFKGTINVFNWKGTVGVLLDEEWEGVDLTEEGKLWFGLKVSDYAPVGVSLYNASGEESGTFIVYPKSKIYFERFIIPLDAFDIDLSNVTVIMFSISNKRNPIVDIEIDSLTVI